MIIEKIQNSLRQHISNIIIQDLNDPKIGFITIINVKTSKDLDFATVYINVLGQERKTEATINALNKATGYIKSLLASRMKIRKIPKLKFVLDKTLEKANKIEELINKIK